MVIRAATFGGLFVIIHYSLAILVYHFLKTIIDCCKAIVHELNGNVLLLMKRNLLPSCVSINLKYGYLSN